MPARDPALARIFESFVARCRDDAATMRESLLRADYATIRALAHRMVGAAGALEDPALVEIARALAAGARAGDERAIVSALRALEAALADRG